MSRNDPIYMKVHLDIIQGEKFSQLTANERDTFIFGPWRLAVKYRKTTGTFLEFSWKFTGNYLKKDWRVTQRHYVKFHNIGLITIYECGSITVHGVRECHAKLHWNDNSTVSPYGAKPHPRTLPIWVPISCIVGQHDSKTGRCILTPIPSSISSDISIPDRDGDMGSKRGSQESGKNPDTYLSGIEARDASWRICEGLHIDDTIKNMASLRNMFASWPGRLVQDAYGKTRDKQAADKAGFNSHPDFNLAAVIIMPRF